jgi:hypothetical protein
LNERRKREDYTRVSDHYKSKLVAVAALLFAVAGGLLTKTSPVTWIAIACLVAITFDVLQLVREPGWRFSMRRLLIATTLMALIAWLIFASNW